MTTDEKNMAIAMLSKHDSTFRKYEIRIEKMKKEGSQKYEWILRIYEMSHFKYNDDRPERWEADGCIYNAARLFSVAETLGVLSIVRVQENWGADSDLRGHPCVKIW